MSRFEQFSNLFKTNPTFADPEDEENSESAAQLVERGDDDDEIDQPVTKKVVELGELYPARYAGRRTSRNELKDESDSELESDADSEESDNEDDATGSEAGADTDIEESGSDGDKSGDDDGEPPEVENGKEQDEYMQEDGDDIDAFNQVDQQNEAEKAEAIKAQSVIYNSLLQSRIKLHRSVQISNRLPQYDLHRDFIAVGGIPYKESLKDVQDRLLKLLNDLVHLQTLILSGNPDTKFVCTGEEFKESNSDEENEDEIPSSEDEEEKMDDDEEEEVKPPEVKRLKLDVEEASEVLGKRHESLKKYRNASISKWSERTSVIRMGDSRSFSGFETSVLSYIDKIIGDKERLIRRTQLQRTAYHVAGKPDVKVTSEEQEVDEENVEEAPNTRVHVPDQYDSEIFDDDDFYQHLLREMIERCSQEGGVVDKRWLELQQFRSSHKKKVDHSYNKERKVKYIVHAPLINLMVPAKKESLADHTKDELFKSVFGGLKTSQ